MTKKNLARLQLLTLFLAFLAPWISGATIPELSRLQGTAWKGPYEAAGLRNQIMIVFLNELTAKGELQYFHALGDGPTNVLIGLDDAGCAVTPRALRPNTESRPGQISVYACEDDLKKELSLEQSVGRKAKQSIQVRRVDLSSPEQLEILVSIAGVDVTYMLTETPVDSAVFSSRESIQQVLKEFGEKN